MAGSRHASLRERLRRQRSGHRCLPCLRVHRKVPITATKTWRQRLCKTTSSQRRDGWRHLLHLATSGRRAQCRIRLRSDPPTNARTAGRPWSRLQLRSHGQTKQRLCHAAQSESRVHPLSTFANSRTSPCCYATQYLAGLTSRAASATRIASQARIS